MGIHPNLVEDGFNLIDQLKGTCREIWFQLSAVGRSVASPRETKLGGNKKTTKTTGWLVGWLVGWLNQPILKKICGSQIWINFSQVVVKIKSIWNHHLD